MKCLEEIHLNQNQIVDIPISLANIPTLRILTLSRNRIAEIPYNFGKVRVVVGTCFQIYQYCPHLLTPPGVAQFTNITNLWLDWNKITRIPLVFGGLTQLSECPCGAVVLSSISGSKIFCVWELCGAEELRLEGNPLRRPRLQMIIEEGVSGLLKWCNGEEGVNVGLRNRCKHRCAERPTPIIFMCIVL